MTWLLFMNAVPIACVVAAGAIALSRQDGWGWFLVLALLTGVMQSRITDRCTKTPEYVVLLDTMEAGE